MSTSTGQCSLLSDPSDEEILSHLLALNKERAERT